MKDELQRGLGAYRNDMGLGEMQSWAVCTKSFLAPGPPVITSAVSWSDDAPPGGRPNRIDHAEVLEPRTRSRSNDCKDEKPQGLCDNRQLQAVHAGQVELDEDGKESHAKVMEPRSSAEAMEPRSVTEAGDARCTSVVNKCKGKYRIKFKGAVCHGRACCRGT